MTQRKPSDEEINIKTADIEEGKDGDYGWLKDNEEFAEIFEAGAEWARDYDPWHYVEDGELPKDKEEVFIILGNEVSDKATYREAHAVRRYAFFESECCEYTLDDVKCWMPIPQSQK